MHEWTEEVLEPNKTLFLCFSLSMFKYYDRVRKQFLQLQNWYISISSILNSNLYQHFPFAVNFVLKIGFFAVT